MDVISSSHRGLWRKVLPQIPIREGREPREDLESLPPITPARTLYNFRIKSKRWGSHVKEVRQDNNKLNYSSLVYKWRWGIYQFLKSK
jgi:hypothetical protein